MSTDNRTSKQRMEDQARQVFLIGGAAIVSAGALGFVLVLIFR